MAFGYLDLMAYGAAVIAVIAIFADVADDDADADGDERRRRTNERRRATTTTSTTICWGPLVRLRKLDQLAILFSPRSLTAPSLPSLC